MIVTTAYIIEGKKIMRYLGIVSAARIIVLPGGNKMIQRAWENSVDEAVEILKQKAFELGANAVIAVRFEPSSTYIYATGTAVVIEQ